MSPPVYNPPEVKKALALGAFLGLAALPAWACEPILPFIRTVAPALAFSESLVALLLVVFGKCLLFPFFERRISVLRAAWTMFLGNVLTSIIGVFVAAAIGSEPGVVFEPLGWLFVLLPIFLVCWLPTRRLVEVAPLRWLAKSSPGALSAFMVIALFVSCITFAVSQAAIDTRHLGVYWTIKVCAIFLALLPSVTLTTVWEEWMIWLCSARPRGVDYFTTVLRTNLYVLLCTMAVAAALILPQRLKSPDFLVKRHPTAVAQAER